MIDASKHSVGTIARMKSKETTMHDMALSNAFWSPPRKQFSICGNKLLDRDVASQISLMILVPIGRHDACRRPPSSFESVD